MDATEMDRVVDQRLQAEATGDIAAILDTFANEVEHDLHPGASTGPMRTKADIEGFYTVLFCEVTINSIRNVRRWHGDTYLVDESVMSVTATGHPFGLDGQGRRAEIPALHVFEFADGHISRESGWLDFSALTRPSVGSASARLMPISSSSPTASRPAAPASR
jgi:uncharacterized protein